MSLDLLPDAATAVLLVSDSMLPVFVVSFFRVVRVFRGQSTLCLSHFSPSNNRLPMRTSVEPSSMAISKSPLMPIDSSGNGTSPAA